MNGKNKCKILKDIRREIAKQNDIDLVIEECRFKGDCLGTCPKCEAEVRYLEKELEKRRKLGKTVAIAGLVATLTATSTGCTDLNEYIRKNTTQGIVAADALQDSETPTDRTENEETHVTVGEVLFPESETSILQGKFYPPESSDIPDESDHITDIDEENNESQTPETTAEPTVLLGDPVLPS